MVMVWLCRRHSPPWRNGAELSVGVEPGDLGVRPEDVSDGFDLFFDALLHHELPTDTAHQERQLRSLAAEPGEAGFGGGRRAVDQIVDVGLHELRRAALGMSPAKVMDPSCSFTDRTVRTTPSPPCASVTTIGNSKTRCRQLRGMVAEIRLVEIERRVPVELIEHVALGAGDGAQRPERLPTAHRSVANPQMVAVQTDGGNALRARCGSSSITQVSAKSVPSPDRPPVIDTPSAHPARETAREVGAVHVQAVREHEHMAQRGIVQLPRELLADLVARLRLGNLRRGGPQARLLERRQRWRSPSRRRPCRRQSRRTSSNQEWRPL